MSPRRKPYTVESLERALVGHGVEFSHQQQGVRQWAITTGIGVQLWPDALVYAYVIGLADKERFYKRESTS